MPTSNSLKSQTTATISHKKRNEKMTDRFLELIVQHTQF